ncbi:MAG: hypothetical protein ACKOCK_02425, partial [Chloroflexota bacterium]
MCVGSAPGAFDERTVVGLAAPMAGPCVVDVDTCYEPDAECQVYVLGYPDATFCLYNNGHACTLSQECAGGACRNGLCASRTPYPNYATNPPGPSTATPPASST